MELIAGRPDHPSIRIMTDITGPSYTLVMEMHYRSMMDFGPKMTRWISDDKVHAIYERFIGAKEDSTVTSLWIWLAGTAILTIPAIGNFLKIGL